MRHLADTAGLPVHDATAGAFGQQHVDDLLRRAIAKQLAFVLFVVCDAMLIDQRDELLRRVTRQGRAAEIRVLADEVLLRGARVQFAIGEVATPAAGDADFFGNAFAVVDQQHLEPALPGLGCAKEACGTGADHYDIEVESVRQRPGIRQAGKWRFAGVSRAFVEFVVHPWARPAFLIRRNFRGSTCATTSRSCPDLASRTELLQRVRC